MRSCDSRNPQSVLKKASRSALRARREFFASRTLMALCAAS